LSSRALQVLSFAISPFASPAYNLPIFLFGLYVQESQEAAHLSLQVVKLELLTFFLFEPTTAVF